MKIIFPINGKGSRFTEDGFSNPKPLINILGKPMIFWVIENLNLSSQDEIYFICNQVLQNYDFDSLIRNRFPDLKTSFIFIPHETRGAAETILHGLNKIEEVDDCFMILDCDTIYFDDIVTTYKEHKDDRIFYFEDSHPDPIYSYIVLEDDAVKLVEEKEKISNNANTGAYCFQSGDKLKNECLKLIKKDKKSKGEFYISSIYKSMISNGERIMASKVIDFNCVGTPMQLKLFCSDYLSNKSMGDLRVCFDLDNTLCTFPKIKGDYSTCEPILSTTGFLRFLKKQGVYIIINTARRMRTHNGNVQMVKKDIEKVTLDFLERNKIEYDEIIFGKPYANFYIDDLSANPKISLEKQLGFYESQIDPRFFNKIEIVGNKVTKTGDLDGESYWYANLPKSMSKHAPKIYSQNKKSITMEKIQGIPFSHLLINESLSLKNFKNLLDLLNLMESIECIVDSNIYGNYSNKLKNRYDEFNYENLEGSSVIYHNIKKFLDLYEENCEGKASFIHGDLVFTNIFLTLNGEIKIVDPRGKSHNVLTIYGDLFYDYAKIYQSLMGYDFILLDRKKNNETLNTLRLHFEKFIESKWGMGKVRTIRFISYSLIFSMFTSS